MKNVIDKYNESLSQTIKSFEMEKGPIEKWAIKHFFVNEHNVFMEDDVFFAPCIDELKKYEKWLNERN